MSPDTLRRALFPAAVFVACAFVFMPQAVLGRRTYAAVDLMEPKAPYRDALTRPPEVVSPVQTDQAESLAGPAAFFRALRHGSFQRWDPNVAAGQPAGTLPLNGLLSPFGVGFLFLPAWYAIGLKVFLALVFCQSFTYLLLRRLGTGVGPAVLAGVAYTFSGTNLVLIHRVDAVFVLPALFWATHRLVHRPSAGRAAVLAALVAWAWFEGFPSGWVYCVYATAAWGGWLAWRAAPGLAAFLRRALVPAVALAWGVALSAVTLVPFVSEVVSRGTLDLRAGASGSHIPSIQLFGLFDLSATGPPLTGPWWSGLNPVESVSHVGMVVTLAVAVGLAAAVLGRVRLSPEGAAAWPFFCGMAAVAMVVNFVGTPLLSAVERVPGVARNPIGRSRFLLGLALAVLGALALDAWWSRRGRAGVRASRAAAAAGLAVLGASVLFTFVDFARAASSANRLRVVTGHFALALGLALGAAALAALAVRRPSARARTGVTAVLAALLFAELGWPLRHFTPEAPVRDFYTETAGHRVLRGLLGGRYRFTATEKNFYPNSGQALGLPDLRGLALHSRQFKALIDAFNPQAFGRDPLKIDIRREEWNLTSPLLDDLAVRYFAEGTDELPFGRVDPDADLTWERWAPADSVAADATAGVAPGPLNGMYVPLRARGKCRGAHVGLSLLSGARTVATTTRAAFDVDGGWTGFALLGRALAPGDPYRFTATTAAPGCRVDIGVVGSRVARQLLIEDPDQAVQLVATEQAWIYERPGAWPLVSAHRRWRAFPDQAQLLAWAATRPPTDADVAAYVGPPAGPASTAGRATGDSGPDADPGRGPDNTVESFSVADNSVHARVSGGTGSLVVVSENLSAGWSARVDGRAVPLVAVDGALMGVLVPPGRHTLALNYLPRTFVGGSAVSGTAVLGGGLAVALSGRRRRGRQRPGRRGGRR
jgi:hypothetical protein